MAATVSGDKSSMAGSVEMLGQTLATGKVPEPAQAFNATSIATDVALGALGPVGGWVVRPLLNMAKEQVQAREQDLYHARGVEALAAQQVPGFHYQQVMVGGTPHPVAIDLTAQLSKANAKPWVYTTADASQPEVKALIEAQLSTAQQTFASQHQQHDVRVDENRQQRAAQQEKYTHYLDVLQFGSAQEKAAAVSPGAVPPVILPFKDDIRLAIAREQNRATQQIAQAAVPANTAPQVERVDRLKDTLKDSLAEGAKSGAQAPAAVATVVPAHAKPAAAAGSSAP